MNQRLQDRDNLWWHVYEPEKLNPPLGPPPPQSSITSIASLLAKGKLGKNTTVLQGTKGCRLKHKFWKQWTIVSLLSILSYAFNVSMGSLYSFSKGYWKVESVRSQGMEGQESYELDPSQGMLQKDLDYVHIPMYATIEGISVYVCGYWGKGRVYHFSNVFRDVQWYIKRQKVVHRG